MGNSSASSNSSEGVPEGLSLPFMMWDMVSVDEMMGHCMVYSGAVLYLTFKLAFLLTALPANSALLWLLLRSRRHLSPSQLLALNIAVLDLLYCLVLPLDVYISFHDAPEQVHHIRDSLSALNIFGCPLLLTFMCLERFIAVLFPITYLQLGKWKYRMMVCFLAWSLILCVVVLNYFFQMFALHLALTIVIVALFLKMLMCLVGIAWALRRDRPGDGAGRLDPVKRRALQNIVAVLVPAVIAYLPLVSVVGFIVVTISTGAQLYTPQQCNALQFLWAFPNFGLYIGPLFYSSQIRKISCCAQQTASAESETQAE